MVDLFPIGGRHAVRKHLRGALLGERRERLLRGAPGHHFLIGILVADLAEVEAADRGDVGGCLDRVGEKREAPFHFRRRLQSPVHEALALEAQGIDGRFLADRGQHILQRPPLGGVIEDVAHRDAAHADAAGERVERAQPREVARAAPE